MPTPSQTITKGLQITEFNTGYTALYDSTLHRNLAVGDLAVVTGVHLMSDFYTSGTSGSPTIVYGQHFTDTARIDLNWITFRGCLFDQPPTGLVNGNHAFGITLDYCVVSTETPGAYTMGDDSFSVNRCLLRGSAHTLRTNGGSTDQHITESWLRVTMQDPCDHNDNVFNFGGSGNIYVERCNIDLDPEGGLLTGCMSGPGGPNACVFSGDLSSASVTHMEVKDCLLSGGDGAESTVQFLDGGLTTNITYVATGNRFIRNGSIPVSRGDTNATPTGQITWSSNVYDDNEESIPLV